MVGAVLSAEGVEAGAFGAEPGAVGAFVADKGLHVGPEARAMVQLQQVGAFVGRHVIGDLEGRHE